MNKRTPIDMHEFLTDISVPDISGPLDLSSPDTTHGQKDIFAVEQRKAWDKSVEARCDFTRRIRLTRRADTFFISLWQKSLYGRTLTDIKSDDSMVQFFADNITPIIRDILGESLQTGSWCIVTTPKRRHLVKNFATRISEQIAAKLSVSLPRKTSHEATAMSPLSSPPMPTSSPPSTPKCLTSLRTIPSLSPNSSSSASTQLEQTIKPYPCATAFLRCRPSPPNRPN